APEPAAPVAPGRIIVSPRARRVAKNRHVPVAVLRGTGPNGRIVEADVLAYVEKLDARKVTPVALRLACERGVDVLAIKGSGPGGKVTREDVEKAQPAVAAAGGERRIELTAMRRIIAERMSYSKQNIPCYYLTMDADVTELVQLRNKLNAEGPPKISFNDFIMVACAKAIEKFPVVASQWAGDAIIQRSRINVGFAVGLEEGLIVPVVRDVNRMTIRDVSQATAALVEKARNKRLTPDEYQGGLMTISNLGMFGIKSFIPIVNPGESCILGLGMIGDRVVVYRGGMQIRKVMEMCLAVDHRVVDGAVGAQFLEAIKDNLESPAGLVG
ncbi:MAG: dihydrolipoamide acetyltransferase family protein, partial [Planctomycetia bacterium]|nr:dihydrolipoamide acetyltransferase family protein [Planctomycetia bacterium]